jgi:hypothetical protein
MDESLSIQQFQIATISKKLRDLSVTLGRCRRKYLDVKKAGIKSPYQEPQSEWDVGIELLRDENLSKEIDATYERLKYAWKQYACDFKTRKQVYKFIMSKIRNVDMRKEDCLTQCAQCAAALHMAVNLEKKEMTPDEFTKFLAIEMIVRSYAERAIGYWTCMIHLQQDSFKSRGVPKSNSPQKVIVEALKLFLRDNDRLLSKDNETIKNSFSRKIASEQEINVVIDKIKYQVYCDGGNVYTTNVNENIHLRRIKTATLLKPEYIGRAKKDILSEMK